MGGIFDFLTGSHPQPVPIPQYTGVQIQTSSNALPIPIVYGTNVVAPNIVYAGAFRAVPQYDGKTLSGYQYVQDLIFALSEGPIARIGYCFQNSNIYTLNQFGGGSVLGGQPAPPSPTWVFSGEGLRYDGTAYIYAYQYDLGSSASVNSVNIEVHGLLNASAGLNSFDADPALMIQDFLTNTTYGLGMPPSTLDLATLLSPASGNDSSYQGYCKAAQLGLSAALTSTEKANSIVSRWLQLTNSAALWSGGQLKIIPYGDSVITQAPTTGQITQPVPAIDGGTEAGPQIPYITVNAGFISDGGVVYASNNAPLQKIGFAQTPSVGQYAVDATGDYAFSSQDINELVTVTFTYAPIAGFVPQLVPLYDLDDDNFVAESDADPVTVLRSDPSQIGNVQRVEILDRNNFYSATTIEARDQNAIETFGYRLGDSVTAHEITNAQSAQVVAQLILQRNLGIRNTYQFKLSWEFCLLEPMDIVTLTDVNLGLAKTPVRILTIEEDDQGLLAFTAEEIVAGVGTAMFYGTSGSTPVPVSTSTIPAPVVPFILEAPSQIAGSQVEMIFGATSTANGAPDPNYGSCNVLVSYDNGATYTTLVSFNGESATGVTTADLPAFPGSGADTGDTLSVNMASSGGTFAAGSPAAARNLQDLVMVGGEMISYGSASAGAGQAASTYALTYLERGVYGSASVDHPAGTPVLSLAGITGSAVLPLSAVGTLLYFKFQAVNIFGAAQPLSTCTAYPYTPVGSGLFGPVAQAIAAGTSLDEGLASSAVTSSDDYGLASDPFARLLDMGLASA